MRKIDADRIKSVCSANHQYEAALTLIPREELRSFLNTLDLIQAKLERSISECALDMTHDLLDDENSQIIRVCWFSKGMSDYYLCIDGSGAIRTVDDEMPEHLLKQIIRMM